MLSVTPFEPEAWMAELPADSLPRSRVCLAQLPTPVHRLRLPADVGDAGGVEVHLKRDDLTSFELSGNKVGATHAPYYHYRLNPHQASLHCLWL
jgi:hypothetical protein